MIASNNSNVLVSITTERNFITGQGDTLEDAVRDWVPAEKGVIVNVGRHTGQFGVPLEVDEMIDQVEAAGATSTHIVLLYEGQYGVACKFWYQDRSDRSDMEEFMDHLDKLFCYFIHVTGPFTLLVRNGDKIWYLPRYTESSRDQVLWWIKDQVYFLRREEEYKEELESLREELQSLKRQRIEKQVEYLKQYNEFKEELQSLKRQKTEYDLV